MRKLKRPNKKEEQRPVNNGTVFHSGTKGLRRMLGRRCPQCELIDSGEVAMYQVTCPQCGEIPPSRKHLYPSIKSTEVCAIS